MRLLDAAPYILVITTMLALPMSAAAGYNRVPLPTFERKPSPIDIKLRSIADAVVAAHGEAP